MVLIVSEYTYVLENLENNSGIHFSFGYFPLYPEEKEREMILYFLKNLLKSDQIFNVFFSPTKKWLKKNRKIMQEFNVNYKEYKIDRVLIDYAITFNCDSEENYFFILKYLLPDFRIIFRIKKSNMSENLKEIELCLNNISERDLFSGYEKFCDLAMMTFYDGAFFDANAFNLTQNDFLNILTTITEKYKIKLTESEDNYL